MCIRGGWGLTSVLQGWLGRLGRFSKDYQFCTARIACAFAPANAAGATGHARSACREAASNAAKVRSSFSSGKFFGCFAFTIAAPCDILTVFRHNDEW